MGEQVALAGGRERAPAEVRARLQRSVAALGRMVGAGLFDAVADTVGLEVELDLVDPLGRPRPVNGAVLDDLGRSDVQAELGRFNLELNVEPTTLGGHALSDLDARLSAALGALSAVSQRHGARTLAIGTLPTLHAQDLLADRLTPQGRYLFLEQALADLRRHPVTLDISGEERLRLQTDGIGVQSAATSLQVHLRVTPQDFARYLNAAQVVAPVQIATGANSPYLLGRALWAETRIPLIEQSLDCRPAGAGSARPPRVWFGDHWVTSATDLWAENVAVHEPLLPFLDDEDPLDAVAAGRVPALHELRLHNGTVWRWNRPVYDVQHGHPHLRIENRVLPSGPTAPDMVANTALYLGLLRAVADLDPPVARVTPFARVAADFVLAARDGLDAMLHWPGRPGVLSVPRLVHEVVLPLAAQGLDSWGVDAGDRDRYLGLVASRVAAGRTGASWQVATARALDGDLGREAALRETVRRYAEHSATQQPVHTWPVPG